MLNQLMQSAVTYAPYLIPTAALVGTYLATPSPSQAFERALQANPNLAPKIKALLKASLEPFREAELEDAFIEEEFKHFLVYLHQYKDTPEVAAFYYVDALKQKLHQSLEAKLLPNAPEAGLSDISANAMSYIWGECNTHKKRARGFIDRLAAAHGFIQVTGWSTQNENSLFAIFDLYNYWRHIDNLDEYRSVLEGILDPLFPLYYEYRELTQREKNPLKKVYRIVLPMFIAAGFLLATAILIAPFAIHEFAFIVFSIPTIYLGLFIASQYIAIKNNIYHAVRRTWYGGTYATPDFELNGRMAASFGEHANTIQDFYIDALKACDDIEKCLSEKPSLKDAELALRQDNQNRRRTLIMEWFDIHENTEIGFDKVAPIVLNRLKQDKKALYKQLKTFCNEEKTRLEPILEQTRDYLEKESQKLLSDQEAHTAPNLHALSMFKAETPLFDEFKHIDSIHTRMIDKSA